MTPIFVISLLGMLISGVLVWLLRSDIRPPRTLSGASKGALASTFAIIAIIALLSGTILFQESTGTNTSLSGGATSDARQWIKAHEKTPPQSSQEGDNIKLLRDGRIFFTRHASVLPPESAAALNLYASLPDTPRSLLSNQQKAQYFEAATLVWQTISGLAQTP